MHIKRQVDSSLHDTKVSQSEGSVLYAVRWWADLLNHIRHMKRVQNYKWGLLHPTLGISGHFFMSVIQVNYSGYSESQIWWVLHCTSLL